MSIHTPGQDWAWCGSKASSHLPLGKPDAQGFPLALLPATPPYALACTAHTTVSTSTTLASYEASTLAYCFSLRLLFFFFFFLFFFFQSLYLPDSRILIRDGKGIILIPVMESAARSRYHRRPDEGGGAEPESRSHVEQEEEEEEVPCVLDMYVHHARGIHNICIYANQDVYAKLSLTSAPDHAPPLTTRVAAGGGAAPRFDERLPPLRVRRGRLAVDVLKCEVWMRSCAKRLLDDQLLGFALVPLAAVAAADGARLLDRDFELSSTDLFHSPAGTIRLSLALRSGIPGDAACPPPESAAEPSIASEVVILEPPPPPPPVDYSRIEFDDLKVDQENQAMAVQYLPFLHLGETRRPPEAMEMSTSPRGEKTASSSDGSKNASTTSTVSDDRVISSSGGAAEKPLADEVTMAPMSCRSPDTPTSCSGEKKDTDVFKSPLGDIDIDMEAEQSAMQRQIMEMYVKSMQQFSESLAKVQLPLELDGAVVEKAEKPDNKAIHMQQQQVKKDGARVFYGSRAFF